MIVILLVVDELINVRVVKGINGITWKCMLNMKMLLLKHASGEKLSLTVKKFFQQFQIGLY